MCRKESREVILIHYISNTDEPLKDRFGNRVEQTELWAYSDSIPYKGDHVSFFDKIFIVKNIVWMHGEPMHDPDTLSRLPNNRRLRDVDLHTVVIGLQYIKRADPPTSKVFQYEDAHTV